MMTLQDVLDAVGTTPERYGTKLWRKNGKPWCPLAVEVLSADDLSFACSRARLAAAALGCSEIEIRYFTTWWDAGCQQARTQLEAAGYRVPPDSVLQRAKRS